ncbi:SANT/Myb-like DNA-binding domain-containing protein [Bacillus sp. FJAT-45350]|uniref:SANT/Myb-like DNA-binding domain-containing protein n=1 Tax=Bacillus sp. FJAT-45350 TaxID=2011014 RepID=UPI000BB9407C|nr:SANT/Myb-like DNA-binding domain-containing protein [Bacillus sp. FJAT-45350]
MPKKKKYWFHYCRECEIDFLVAAKVQGMVSCPKCGDGFYTEKVRSIWLERPFSYRRPWTSEEDDLVLASVEQGYTHQEISDSLNGRTKNAVTRRLQQLRKQG